ncbi:MAG TPA: sulfotransferase domain-containing protein [Acidimicrobiales bacterium]|nr:sulfotransferase domain-containing protein [Acidimicrobiales bacterium]
MTLQPPERTRVYRNHHLDSTRWDTFVPRDDDILITTAYKAGTTWTQRILAALILGPGPLDTRLTEISPWIDARFMGPLQPMLHALEGQRHRRFIKSHLAADGLPFFPQAKYIVVGRDTRDVFMSLYNHYSGYTDMMYELLNDPDRPGPELPRCPATPRELWQRWASEGWFEWETDGWPYWSHHHHLSTWWAARELPNVLLVHFGDLKADPETEMRRIAAFCDIDIKEDSWPAVLATVGFEAMREEARGTDDPLAMAWKGGADTFFYKGDSGRWRGVLNPDDLALYEISASTLDPALRTWLEGGRHAVGI